jgi:outer membrane biogenesis lipoprotein LolB
MRLSQKATLLCAAALILVLQGCSTPTPDPSGKVLDGLPLVQNSAASPCWQQRQIASQHAFVDAAKGAKGMAYKAPCDLAPKAVAAAPAAS